MSLFRSPFSYVEHVLGQVKVHRWADPWKTLIDGSCKKLSKGQTYMLAVLRGRPSPLSVVSFSRFLSV